MQSPLKTIESLDQTNAYQMPDYVNSTKSTSCLDILGTQSGIYIQQTFKQFYMGLNEFKVYGANHLGEEIKFRQLFKCYEQSSDCTRFWLGPQIRPFEMMVDNYQYKSFYSNISYQQKQNSDLTIFKFKREYQCTFCCFNRPRLEVHYVENGQNIFLGYISDPVYCCQIGSNIFNSNGDLIFKIEANTCQSYFWLRCPCSVECNKINFQIKLPTGQMVAPIQKQIKTCLNSQQNRYSDNINILFPKQASKEDKALILAATIMIEFMYFEKDIV
ncbi:unnamed protein product [Paramecium primaurelia]|uniref:Phospholipid scramblase n=1 Tax=Paramecium primaurelia TaxID=5886 RepID=A0A8S1LTH7_PARPR|nr:unnamed protein product [Paramecium primaurelia]